MPYVDKVTVNNTTYDIRDTTTAQEVSDLKGQLSEETRNLFDIYSVPTRTGITNTDGTLKGTAEAFNSGYSPSTVGLAPDLTFESNIQYVISFEAKNNSGGSGNGLAIVIVYTDNTVGNIVCNMSESIYTQHYTVSASGKTISKICAGYFSGSLNEWEITNIQIEKGTTKTSFIPHLTAADYVARESIAQNTSTITTNKGLSDAEDVKIESQIESFNVWNVFNSTINSTSSGLTVVGGDGFIKLNGEFTQSGGYFDIIYLTSMTNTEIKPGTDYWFDSGLRNLEADGKYVIYFNVGSGLYKAYDYLSGVSKISIPANATNFLLRYYPPVNVEYSNKIIRTTLTQNKPVYYQNNSAEFRFLRAFGTGDCTIIKFADGTTLVIDFGMNEPQGTLQSSWNSAITELGITHIDYAIISHYHPDHCGMLLAGISSLIDSNSVFFLPNGHAFTTAELEALAWVDEMANDNIVENYEAVMGVLETAGCELRYPVENETWIIGGAEIKFWNADHSEYMAAYEAHTDYDYNTCSLCNYITIGAERLCFSGDISVVVMTKYNKTVLPSQIFKVNHHSNGYAVVPLFLNTLMPELDVAMLGYNLAIGTLGTNPNQLWCEANFVSNVVTGINQKTLSLKVTEGGYIWNTACRKCIRADEGISTT